MSAQPPTIGVSHGQWTGSGQLGVRLTLGLGDQVLDAFAFLLFDPAAGFIYGHELGVAVAIRYGRAVRVIVKLLEYVNTI